MQRFRNILVLTNSEGASAALVARARWLAESNGAALTFVDVIERAPGELGRLIELIPGKDGAAVEQSLDADRAKRLAEIAAPLQDDGLSVRTKLLNGIATEEVVRLAGRGQFDLILKAADRTPVHQVLRGPDLHLVRKAPCPVWVLNSASEPSARRILAAIDPDPRDPSRHAVSHQVMDLACALARCDEAKLHVLHAWFLTDEDALRRAGTPEEEITALLNRLDAESGAYLADIMEEYSEYADLCRAVHVKGRPADVIADHAEIERIDTIVMGTVGRTSLSGFYTGKTAETVLNRVACSVLTVKPQGFAVPQSESIRS